MYLSLIKGRHFELREFSIFSGCTRSQAVNRRPLITEDWVHSQPVSLGFMTDKEALRQGFVCIGFIHGVESVLRS